MQYLSLQCLITAFRKVYYFSAGKLATDEKELDSNRKENEFTDRQEKDEDGVEKQFREFATLTGEQRYA